jgi:predicted MFS family arabinose efflux permease
MAGAIGWGSFVGLMGLTIYGNVEHKGRIVLFGMLAYCLVLVAFTQSSVLWLTLIFLTIAGVFHGVALTITQTLVQMLARNDMRGRATAVFQMGFGLMPVGALPLGFAIERWGAQTAVGTAIAISAAVFAFMSIFWVSLRRA